MGNVVLVVDMVRGFCEEGYPLYLGPAIREMIPRLRSLLEEERSRGSRLIYLCDNHAPGDAEFRMFPPHCIRGTDQAEVIPELGDLADEVIPKARFSGFYGTDLDGRLRELRPEKVIVVGDCTNICVLYTVADARNRGYEVIVPADGVVSFDRAAHQFALEQMEKVLGAKVVASCHEIAA